MSLHFFGIRHHGPGCARALLRALDELQPDLVLLEGPPEAANVVSGGSSLSSGSNQHSLSSGSNQHSLSSGSNQHSLLSWVCDEDMVPPVALLFYLPDQPQHSLFFPFADYSPEWQTLRWALPRQIPVRWMDMPAATSLALEIARLEAIEAALGAAQREAQETEDGDEASAGDATSAAESAAETASSAESAAETASAATSEDAKSPAGAWLDDDTEPIDGLALLAEAAGFQDPELWWEHAIERRSNTEDLFASIAEAMTAARSALPRLSHREACREAFMRQAIRAAQRDGYQRIAVVGGAWHVPALQATVTAKADQELIKGLPKIKVEAAWVPWTNERLALRSGYGAGVESPGWYAHLWQDPSLASLRWLAQTARLLRAEDLDAPPASLIEAARLADTLASLRELRAPGLTELREATRAVLCHGNEAGIALIRRRLEIGDQMGRVPASAPALPLRRDFEAQLKTLRLKKAAAITPLDLDLRKSLDHQRSAFLHRLRAVGLDWAKQQSVVGKAGTFHELWQLEWRPELEIQLIEASLLGQTVEGAAIAGLCRNLAEADLPKLTASLDLAILGELPQAISRLLTQLQATAALAADVDSLMAALPPLARVARYGSVRGTPSAQIEPVIAGLFERALIAFLPASLSLDDAAATQRLASLQHLEAALTTLDRAEWLGEYLDLLERVVAVDSVHGLLRGYGCRALLEAKRLDAEALGLWVSRALSPALPPSAATAWIQGLMKGNPEILLHQDALWRTLDFWLAGLGGDAFQEQLPLLRRAFAQFEPPARRAMGDKVRQLSAERGPAGTTAGPQEGVAAAAAVHPRAARLLPILTQILRGAADGRA